MDQSTDTCCLNSLGDMACTTDGVLLELLLGAPVAHFGSGMEDSIYTLASFHQAVRVANIASHALDIKRAEELSITAGADQSTHPVAGQCQLFRQVRAEQAGRPRYHVTYRHARIL